MRPASEADACAGEQGVTQASDTVEDEGVGTGMLVVGGIGLLAVLVVAGVVLVRRRGTVEDRE